jgi:hypothetical protein
MLEAGVTSHRSEGDGSGPPFERVTHKVVSEMRTEGAMIRRLTLSALLVVSACRRGSPRADTTTTTPTPSPATTSDSVDARLETGCTGGVTGGGRGSSVSARGDIYRWDQATPNADQRIETFIAHDSTRVATFFRDAEARGLTRTTFSEPSNVTCSLTLIRGTQRHSIAWPMGATPSKIEALVELAKAIDSAATPR